MSDENVELVRRALEAAFRKPKPDFDTVNSLFHPDHELVSMVSRPGKGLRGGSGFRQWLTDQNEAWASWRGKVGEVKAVDDHRVLVVVDFVVEGKHSGLPYEQRTAVLVTVRGGKLARSETYMSAEAALETARATESVEAASNVEVVRRVYAEWSRGNMKAGPELFDPDIVFESFVPISNQRVVVHGPAEVEAWMRDFLAPVRDYRIFGERFTEIGEDTIMVEGHHSSVGRHSGVAVDAPIHSAWKFRNGKVTRLVWDPDLRKVQDATGLPEPATSRENVEIVRRVFEAVARRDTETVLSLYDPDVEWDGTRHRWSEVLGLGTARFHGHDGLRKWSRTYYEMWESLEDEIEELIDAGEQVISIVTTRARGRGSGVEVEWKHNVGLWTIRDRKVVRVVWFPTRGEALEAAGLKE